MISDNEVVKLILGFKVRYLRLREKISYQELSNETGLSISYLNDIEKGKKYPKPDKINALARVFGIEYDELVSTRADKKLRPVVDLLSSGLFKYFPLNEFGISLEKLIDVFSNSPDRFSAFISTILKMVRSYQIEKEHFFRIALRSYLDMHDNYFPDLEEAANTFRQQHKFSNQNRVSYESLSQLLLSNYGVAIDGDRLTNHPKLRRFRSYFQPEKKVLYLNDGLTEGQKVFILAKEIGFQFLEISERPFETELNKEASFEKLLNNFKASYFAAALIMNSNELVEDLEVFSRATTWSPDLITSLLEKYQVTPETLLQRFTNLLPKHFNVKDLFFIRLKSTGDLIRFNITKELHLSRLHTPYHTEIGEHLCHRWISISAIKNVRNLKQKYLIDSQISEYWQTNKSYFCITAANSDGFYEAGAGSVTLGLMMNERLKGAFNFIKDPDLKKRTVHTTCERCSMPDCDNRVAEPKYIDQMNDQIMLQQELEKL